MIRSKILPLESIELANLVKRTLLSSARRWYIERPLASHGQTVERVRELWRRSDDKLEVVLLIVLLYLQAYFWIVIVGVRNLLT